MRWRFLTVLACLTTLFVELSLDSSTPFVRSGAEPVIRLSLSADSSDPMPSDSDSDDSNASYTYSSASHSAGPVMTFSVPAPSQPVYRFSAGFISVVEDGFFHTPLRPPIS